MSNLILQSSVVKNTVTEWCLFTPFLSLENFVLKKVETLFDRIISDSLANCLNIEDIVSSSIYSNTTSVIDIIGLKSIIVDAFLKAKKVYIQVEVVNNSIIYTNLTTYNYSKIEDPNNNILVIDATDSPLHSVYDYYGLIFRYNYFANSVLELANKPLIMFNDYRSTNTNLANANKIEEQVRESLTLLKRNNGYAILDAKDRIDMFTVDISNYKELLTQAYTGIADVFGLPLSYFTGEIAGSLNSLGEADRVKTQDVLYRYYKNMLQNVLKRVYSIIGLEYKVVYKEYLEYKLKGVLPILQALDRTELLTLEQKQDYITRLLT